MHIYIHRAGETLGPYDEYPVRRYVCEGQLSGDDLAWREGMSEWVSLGKLLADATLLSPSEEPPPLSKHLSVPSTNAPQAKASSEIGDRDDYPKYPEAHKKGGFGSFVSRLLGKRDYVSYEEVLPCSIVLETASNMDPLA
jgi:hypothetical protein